MTDPLTIVRSVLTWLAALLAFVAALMWWRASTVKIDAKAVEEAETVEGWAPAQIVNTADGSDFTASAIASSRWNKWAAIATGGSVALQGVASLLSPACH